MKKFTEIKEEIYNIIKSNPSIVFSKIIDYVNEDTKKQLQSYLIGVIKQTIIELEDEKRIIINVEGTTTRMSVC